MNIIHRFVTDPEVKKKLKEVSGIGTPATQETIVKKLFAVEYIIEEKNKIKSTKIGRALIAALESSSAAMIVKPDLTAEWEEEMSLIESGKEELAEFIKTNEITIRKIISSEISINEKNMQGITKYKPCLIEGCDGTLRNKKSKEKGSSFFVCVKCNKTFNDKDGEPVMSVKKDVIEVQCPKGCGAKARQRSGQYGLYWTCECSPKESFNDVNGAPAIKGKKELEKMRCLTPNCDGEAVKLFKKEDKTPFWKCDKCRSFFDDVDGAPTLKQGKQQEKAKCPTLDCKGEAKKLFKKEDKTPFWKCDKCGSFFDDVDGAPALKQGRQQEKAKCPTPDCKGEAKKLFKKEDKTPFWKCDVCGNYLDDVEGKPQVQKKKSKG